MGRDAHATNGDCCYTVGFPAGMGWRIRGTFQGTCMDLGFFTKFLSVILILISILMILVILVQRGRGGGLAGAFGAGGGGNTAFGTKTGDVFTTVTVVFFVIFI